ncbi:aspartyl protease family protein [Candidatus Leptofilum sp.]|uniref:retropepsin-like aspartic protease n=1 Tax=Candidatus Leptofilum sp. TaxID=3241576 RepID=UPI003B5A80B2
MNETPPLETANNLWQQGHFSAAAAIYRHLVQENSHLVEGFLHLGKLALWQNQFAEAEQWLQKTINLVPDDSEPMSLLAELFYRQDQFWKAAPFFRRGGREAQADKLASFREKRPYHLEGATDTIHIPFLQTDPLPLLAAKLNGQPVHLLLDTGASELIIDPAMAEQIGVTKFGAEGATFAGGKQASYEHGRLDSLSLGDWTIQNLPVHLLDTSRFTTVTGGVPVHGIIGTVLFYHFLATIDYPQNQLTLRRPSAHADEVDQEVASIPFWLVGDHLMMAWGTMNQSEPLLMLVDTGLAGGGFLCPQSTLEVANIAPPSDGSFTGEGGGGQVTAVPFNIEQLTLGDTAVQNVVGIYGPFPPSLEHGLGFHVGGLISHGFFRSFALTFDFNKMRLILN